MKILSHVAAFVRSRLLPLVALLAAIGVQAQTDPAAQTLPFTLTAQSGGTLPAGVAVHSFSTIPTTRLATPGTANANYTTGSTTGGWRDESANGLSLLASGSSPMGAVVVAINTVGKTGIQVSWLCRTILQQASRDDSIALQYRVGNSGNFIDVGTLTTYSSQSKSAGDVSSVLSETLPVAAENQPVVQLRWLYWESTSTSGSRDRVALDDISITSGVVSGPPAVGATSPTNGTASVSVSAPLTITFTQPVTVVGAWYSITSTSSGTVSATVSGGPSTFTLTPTANFAYNDSVTVSVFASQVTDQLTGTVHPAANDNFSFTTASAPGSSTPIHTVQGSGAASPLVNQTVTVTGIVTGFYNNTTGREGFYLQEADANADADPLTSEGVYVYAAASPTQASAVAALAVGDVATVSGTVQEFSNLTEIAVLTNVTKTGTAALPTPAIVTLPLASATFLERYEGMRVTLNQTLTVTNTFNLGRYGEVEISSGGRLPEPTNIVAPGGPALAQQAANDLNRITMDDDTSATYVDPTAYLFGGASVTQNTLRSGDTVTGITGILTYIAGINIVEPTTAPVFTRANPRSNPPVVGGTLRVVGTNVLNFFNGNGAGGGFPTSRGADTPAEFTRQRDHILAMLTTLNADVYGLTEVENDGFGSNSAVQDLVNGLNALATPGTTYAFCNPGVGTIGTDAITCAIIYRTNTVAPVGSAVINLDGVFNRPPLAQTFRQLANNEKFTVCVNHFKSKGSAPSGSPGSNPDVDQGDGQDAWNNRRTLQANALTAWLASNPTGDNDADVLIIGDLNSYAKEDPITAIKNAGYTNLTEQYEGPAGYSYSFDGQFGHLDHALAKPSLASQITGAQSWHNNSDEPTILDYNIDLGSGLKKSAAQQAANNGSTPWRASDHDPILIGLNLGVPPMFTTQPSSQTVASGGTVSFTLTATGTPPPTYQWRKNGIAITGNASATTATLMLNNVTAADAGTYDVVITNTAGSLPSSAVTLTVGVDSDVPTLPEWGLIALVITLAAFGARHLRSGAKPDQV